MDRFKRQLALEEAAGEARRGLFERFSALRREGEGVRGLPPAIVTCKGSQVK